VRAVALTISFFALALPASAGAQVLTLNCQYEITYDMKLLTKTLETGGFPAIIYINEVPGVARIETTNSGRFVYVGGFDEQELTGDCERVDGTAKFKGRLTINRINGEFELVKSSGSVSNPEVFYTVSNGHCTVAKKLF
jgi:hypothetical protein